jgi:tetratricopeptide (TPR) repeat protein
VSFTKEAKAKFGKANLGGKFDEARTVIAEVLKSPDPCCQAIGFSMEAILLNTEGKTNESFESATRALALLKNKYNTFASIEGNRMIGMYYNRKGNMDSSVIFYYKSLEHAEKENDQYTLAKLYANISLVYINQKQIDKGLELTKKSLGAAMLSKDTNAIAQAYSNMVTIYGQMYENGLYGYFTAIGCNSIGLCKSKQTAD